MEILWTGLHAFRIRNPKLTGSSSLWMFPIYGSAAFLAPIMQKLKNAPLFKRGFVYMSCIFLGEYISGSLLKRRNMCPWDYSGRMASVNGLIRLDFAPLWFMTGLLFEQITKKRKK